jgi:hypothetical protein
MGDDAIVPDSQDYGIVPDLASCLPRNSPSLKVCAYLYNCTDCSPRLPHFHLALFCQGYLPVLEAHRLPAKHGRRAAAGIASVHPAASPYVNGGPGGPRSKASRSKVKQHPSVSFEGGETETGAPILRSPSGREVRVLAPLKGGELQSKPHVPTMSHHVPSATPLSELRMRWVSQGTLSRLVCIVLDEMMCGVATQIRCLFASSERDWSQATIQSNACTVCW